MKIKIHNDGKSKYQSFEAYIDECSITGYGHTEEEAKGDLSKQLKEFCEKILNINYDSVVYVDWSGKEITK